MNEPLRWLSLKRQGLPGIVAEGVPSELLARSSDRMDLESSDVVIGYVSGSKHPSIAILRDASARETLAWLATYSPASFPLSQRMRVLTEKEFSAPIHATITSSSPDVYQWSSIVLGELLGQVEQQIGSIDSVPLALTHSCFSFAQARADLNFGTDSHIARLCKQRLQSVQSEKVFSKRTIGVNDLDPIWHWMRRDTPEYPVVSEIVATLTALTQDRPPDEVTRNRLQGVGFVWEALARGSLEDRVRAFQAFSKELVGAARGKDEGTSHAVAMLLAAAAISVGNGTSHISLLQEFASSHPATYPWFGFFAGAAGPSLWDPAWNRAVNTLARFFRNTFELADPPVCDLSWVEFEFVRAVPNPVEFLKHLPKLSTRILSIEVVPGAICQFRLHDEGSSRSSPRTNVEQKPPVDDIYRDRDAKRKQEEQLSDYLMQLERMRVQTEAVLRELRKTSASADQSSLFEQQNSTATRNSPGRRQKKSD
jgi:hypothetical protein